MPSESDWRDGFLFVGNQLSLDFLNTQPVIDGSPVELLPDPAALLRWLVAAGLLNKHKSAGLARAWPAKADRQLQYLRDFRDAYRRVILDREAGRALPQAFLSRMNGLLAQHAYVDEIVGSESGLARRRRFDPRGPSDALAPVLDAAVDLLVTADRSRIRKCDSCALQFYDASKKGTRRWCSMQICGNRSKVAAYAQRQREL